MKKFFKDLEEAKKSDSAAVAKVLKKVFGAWKEDALFFYKAEFEYENGEVAPFIYIGEPTPLWKKFIKSSKMDKDFVAGICKYEKGSGGEKKLLMEAQAGKGNKPLFLKGINKKLLKAIKVEAEFVDSIAPTEVVPPELTAKLLSEEVATITDLLKDIRIEHDEEQIDSLLAKIKNWEDGFKNLSNEEKNELSDSKNKVQEYATYLGKVKEVDEKVEVLFDEIYPMIEDYIDMEDHASDEALKTKNKVEKKIAKIESLAAKINDNDFLEACKEFRAVLAT